MSTEIQWGGGNFLMLNVIITLDSQENNMRSKLVKYALFSHIKLFGPLLSIFDSD